MIPLLWVSLAFLAGILSSKLAPWPPFLWLVLAGLWAAFLIAILKFKLGDRLAARLPRRLPPAPLPVPLLLAIVCLGAARASAAVPQITPNQIAWYNDRQDQWIVEGLLVDLPDERDALTYLRMRVDRARPESDLNFRPVEGLVLAGVAPGDEWHYGDRVRLEGALVTPSENEEFSYRDYLARQGVFSEMRPARARILGRGQGSRAWGALYAFKERSLALTARLFPEPESALLQGILLGSDNRISPELKEAFQATGTAHIIAISGFNMTIIAGLFAGVFSRLLGRRRGAVAAGVGVALYTLLAGATPAVVRAALMAGLGLFGRQVGRRQHGLNTLAFVAALMALANPGVLADPGFQLSFMATLGLVLYADPLDAWFVALVSRRISPAAAARLAGPVGEFFLFTLAAQLTTLPITLVHFQRLSLVAVLANPLVLPVQPAVMVLSGLAVLLAHLWLPLGQALAWLAWPFSAYTIRIVELSGRLPGGALELGRFSLLAALACYALLFGWTFARRSLPRVAAVLTPSLGLAGLGALAIVAWQGALVRPDGRLHLVMLDVGAGGVSGDALLLQTPDGRRVLIGGGPSPGRLYNALGRRLPLGRRRLDWLVVPSPDSEDLAALPESLARFPPAAVLWSGAPAGSRDARLLREALARQDVPITIAQAGQALDLGSGARLRILTAGGRGASYLLEWGNFHALLPIGVDFAALEALAADRSLVEPEVLLLSNAGYAPANPPEWLSALRPRLVLLSVAAGDRSGLPDEETLDAVAGCSLLRTDINGWIEIETDGEKMWVAAAR